MHLILRYYIEENQGRYNEKEAVFNNYMEDEKGNVEFNSYVDAYNYFVKLSCEFVEVKKVNPHFPDYPKKRKIKVFHTIEKRDAFLSSGEELNCNFIN